jgi:ATP-binding cassette subfamily B protein
MSSASDHMPSALTSLLRSLRLGYQASPLQVILAFATTLAAAAPDALFALGLARLVGSIQRGDSPGVLLAALGLGVLATASWIFNIVSERANLRFAERAAVVIETHVAHLQSSIGTIEHHERKEFMDRLSILRDHAGALSYLYKELFSAFGAVLRLVITIVLLVSVDPWLGLLGLAAIPMVMISNWQSRALRAVEESQAFRERNARHLFTVGTSGAYGGELRVTGVQQWLRQKRRQSWKSRYVALARARWRSALWSGGAQALLGLAFAGAVFYVATTHGDDAAAATMLVLAAGSRLSQYVGQTVNQAQFFRAIWLDASRRLAWLEDLAAAAAAQQDLPVPTRLQHEIRFEAVSFRYPDSDRYALEDITMTLPAGKVIAIVGENGAGKSSVVKLLTKMYAPTTGRITVDGADLDRIPTDRWRKRLSGAFQDFVQFEYPAQRAIGFGDVDRLDDPEAATRAAQRAGADEVIARLPHGLATQLGATWSDGVNVSHGQWQRIALARGFMRDDPLVLVLDEPTSALDAEVEHAIFERYAHAARAGETSAGDGRIVILVSHRFSTVRMAEVILVLSGSKIIEHGSHAELMDANGHYADLYRTQAAAYLSDVGPHLP